jgi:hypothetical protein
MFRQPCNYPLRNVIIDGGIPLNAADASAKAAATEKQGKYVSY